MIKKWIVQTELQETAGLDSDICLGPTVSCRGGDNSAFNEKV